MLSKKSIIIIANLIASSQRDKVVSNIEGSLRNALSGEKISKVGIQRILNKFTEGLKRL